MTVSAGGRRGRRPGRPWPRRCGPPGIPGSPARRRCRPRGRARVVGERRGDDDLVIVLPGPGAQRSDEGGEPRRVHTVVVGDQDAHSPSTIPPASARRRRRVTPRPECHRDPSPPRTIRSPRRGPPGGARPGAVGGRPRPPPRAVTEVGATLRAYTLDAAGHRRLRRGRVGGAGRGRCWPPGPTGWATAATASGTSRRRPLDEPERNNAIHGIVRGTHGTSR